MWLESAARGADVPRRPAHQDHLLLAVPRPRNCYAPSTATAGCWSASAWFWRVLAAGQGYTGFRADVVVHIDVGPWLHVPMGKLHEDRYLPLQPQMVALVDNDRPLRPRKPGRAA
jgi:hypothetical protein